MRKKYTCDSAALSYQLGATIPVSVRLPIEASIALRKMSDPAAFLRKSILDALISYESEPAINRNQESDGVQKL